MSVQISFNHVVTMWFKEESVNVPEITMVILLVEQIKTLSLISENMLLNLKMAGKQNYPPTPFLRACILSVTLMVTHMSCLILSPLSVEAQLPFVT